MGLASFNRMRRERAEAERLAFETPVDLTVKDTNIPIDSPVEVDTPSVEGETRVELPAAEIEKPKSKKKD